MALDEKLESLHQELAEYKETLSEMRRRIENTEETPDSEVGFHQDVLVKMQHAAWEIQLEIIRLTPKEN